MRKFYNTNIATVSELPGAEFLAEIFRFFKIYIWFLEVSLSLTFHSTWKFKDEHQNSIEFNNTVFKWKSILLYILNTPQT